MHKTYLICRRITILLVAIAIPASLFGTLPQLYGAHLKQSKPFADSQLINKPPTDDAAIKASANQRKRKRKTLTWTELHKMYPGVFFYGGSRNSKKVALTFDDVPDLKYTPQVLDILSKHRVPATFFVMGTRAARYPSVVSRIRQEGHMVGNHSYNHPSFPRISKRQFQQQISRTDEILRPLIGYSPRFIRPPYGEITAEQVEWAKKNGYIIVNWDVDSEDWKGIGSNRVLRNIQRTLQPGSIILQHAGGSEDLSGTIKALPKLIEMLQDNGYEIVPLPELLNRSVDRKVR
ncbi:polysaccharide deacetylase family protein [Paenibacillus sp. GCM10027626]|uniref:polysaccharide deacetylase family protein n=1 Tax=Paenibacillus sp. GCM10027626 TaxID=3273411 RepID=UPI00362BA78A